jgi:hypothetical protein
MVLAGLSVLTAMVLAVQPTRHATRHGAPDPMVQPRPAREEDLARDAIPPGLYARAHSFWGETSLAPCAVSAVWTGDLAFAPLMRLPAAEGLPARTPAIEPGTPANVRVVDFRPAPRRRPKRRYDTFRQAA